MGQISTPRTSTFILGSGDVKVGATEATVVSLGSANGIKFEESFEKVELEVDNYGKIDYGIKNHEAKVSGQFLEIDLEQLSNIRGGIDTYSTVAGTLVEGAEQTIEAGDHEAGQLYLLDGQNDSGAVPTINSVTLDPDGTPVTLVAGTDYRTAKDVSGKWGIVFISGSDYSTSYDIVIDTDYTPSASKILKSGGKIEISAKVVQIVHTNADGDTFTITLYSAKTEEGMTLEFPSDNADSALAIPFAFKGTCDGSRTVGDQLFKIVDTRSYT